MTGKPHECNDRSAHRRSHDVRDRERHVAATDPVDDPTSRPEPHHDEGHRRDTGGVVPGADRLWNRVRHRLTEEHQPQAVVPEGGRGTEDRRRPRARPRGRWPLVAEAGGDSDRRPECGPDPRRPSRFHEAGAHRVERPAGTRDGSEARPSDGHASDLVRPTCRDQLRDHARRDEGRREHPNCCHARLLRSLFSEDRGDNPARLGHTRRTGQLTPRGTAPARRGVPLQRGDEGGE